MNQTSNTPPPICAIKKTLECELKDADTIRAVKKTLYAVIIAKGTESMKAVITMDVLHGVAGKVNHGEEKLVMIEDGGDGVGGVGEVFDGKRFLLPLVLNKALKIDLSGGGGGDITGGAAAGTE
ncbi:hypothetical protein L1887_15119 [Cichorium endivia]|nr:hypothetical protein L1887_15119 [Cichorium endivia]